MNSTKSYAGHKRSCAARKQATAAAGAAPRPKPTAVTAIRILPLLFCLTACAAQSPERLAGNSDNADGTASSSLFAASAGDLEKLAELWDKRTRQNAVSNYPIGAGDVLQISVPAMEEIKDRDVRVTADGTISLPFIGRIQAEGFTEADLGEQLRVRLQEYLRNPRVFIFVKEYNSRQVAVLGAVARPGLYHLTNGAENILDMISRAGGVLPEAEPRIQLIPTEPLAGEAVKQLAASLPPDSMRGRGDFPILRKTEPIIMDVKELSYGGRQMYLSLPVRPGDTIMIPGGAQILVEGWVDKPGAYKMTPGLTLTGAVAAAGGELFAADNGSVRVIRAHREGKKSSLTADLEKIKNGEIADIALQGGDIVQVTASTVKLIPWGIYGLLKDVIRVGFGGTIR